MLHDISVSSRPQTTEQQRHIPGVSHSVEWIISLIFGFISCDFVYLALSIQSSLLMLPLSCPQVSEWPGNEVRTLEEGRGESLMAVVPSPMLCCAEQAQSDTLLGEEGLHHWRPGAETQEESMSDTETRVSLAPGPSPPKQNWFAASKMRLDLTRMVEPLLAMVV